jgi:SAM-dependent methyltransferase
MFFSDLAKHLEEMSINLARDIHSVFEVGCSLGYQLRYCETDLFPSAMVIEGSDIDQYAIRSGSDYLGSIGSKVRLMRGDMEELDRYMKDRIYDITLCTGVLMYLDESAAFRVIDAVLRHTGVMLALTGLAHPAIDNSQLRHSVPRDRDQTFIHNFDSMIIKAGWQIVYRRWEGGNLFDGLTVYFVFAARTSKK